VGMMEGWPGLVMRDPSGKKRVAVFSREEWGSLYFYDRYEVRRTGVGLFGDSAALNLCDDRGKDRTGLTTDRKGSSLSFFDALGKKRVGLGMILRDEPALGFFDEDGQLQVSLNALNAEPSLSLMGTNKVEVSMLISRTNNVPTMRVYGQDRRVLWRAP
jgi:hypothetical protein